MVLGRPCVILSFWASSWRAAPFVLCTETIIIISGNETFFGAVSDPICIPAIYCCIYICPLETNNNNKE